MSYPSAPPYQEYPGKQPPPMGFYPPQQAPPPTYAMMLRAKFIRSVIPVQAGMTPVIVFGPESITMTCPHCNCMVSSETSKEHATCTHICCCLLFCSLGCSLFSCVPYFFCDPAAVEHKCPNCKAKLGTWHS